MTLLANRSNLYLSRQSSYSQADVIIIVYSIDSERSIESVQSKWIPLITEVLEGKMDVWFFVSRYGQKPIIVVGNKLDLEKNPDTINRSTHLHERASSLLEKYTVILHSL